MRVLFFYPSCPCLRSGSRRTAARASSPLPLSSLSLLLPREAPTRLSHVDVACGAHRHIYSRCCSRVALLHLQLSKVDSCTHSSLSPSRSSCTPVLHARLTHLRARLVVLRHPYVSFPTGASPAHVHSPTKPAPLQYHARALHSSCTWSPSCAGLARRPASIHPRAGAAPHRCLGFPPPWLTSLRCLRLVLRMSPGCRLLLARAKQAARRGHGDATHSNTWAARTPKLRTTGYRCIYKITLNWVL